MFGCWPFGPYRHCLPFGRLAIVWSFFSHFVLRALFCFNLHGTFGFHDAANLIKAQAVQYGCGKLFADHPSLDVPSLNYGDNNMD